MECDTSGHISEKTFSQNFLKKLNPALHEGGTFDIFLRFKLPSHEIRLRFSFSFFEIKRFV